jgi:hypothetical protein
MKANCWEFKKCGREPNGSKIKEFGACPSAVDTRVNGVNSGKNGGRCCWAITGTLCGEKVQGTYAMKLSNCAACDFFRLVSVEERADKTHTPLNDIFKLLNLKQQ